MALDLSLAIQSRVALLATTARPNPTVFIEGGFRNNKPYVALLAALLGGSKVFLSDLAEATAFGAAITAKCAVEHCRPAEVAPTFTIATTPVAARPIEWAPRLRGGVSGARGRGGKKTLTRCRELSVPLDGAPQSLSRVDEHSVAEEPARPLNVGQAVADVA